MFELETVLIVTCWVCLGLVVYTYAGYPILVRVLASLFGRKHEAAPLPDDMLPRISLLIAAHNEEGIIAERIENALALDYPADRLEIVVATDGCSDLTAEVVRKYQARNVQVMEYTERRGKANVLNDSIPRLTGDIVILSDANTFTERNAARQLARWFADPTVGVVSGRLILTDPVTGNNADSLYWRYETYLKKCESKLGALLGANGAIYAIRRTHFRKIPSDTIVDDFVIPLQARIRTHCRIIYDATAVAHEESPAMLSSEFRRRSRIGAGGFQSLGLLWKLLNPARGWIAFTFLSHKALRWGCPLFLFGLLVCSALLVREPLYLGLFLAQCAFYTLSALVPYLPTSHKLLKPLRLTTMFTGMNLALLLGFWRWVVGTQRAIWQPTLRTPVPVPGPTSA